LDVRPRADTDNSGGAKASPLSLSKLIGLNWSIPTTLERTDFMAEYSNSAIVTVSAGQNVPFTEEVNTGKPSIVHREGAGLVTLRGLTNQCRAKFKVSFGANIAIPAGGTAEAITAAISINGEALNASTATVTPAAAENFFNIYVSAVVDVPRGCCVTVAAKNTSTQPILVANSNFIVERVA
jgi:hypothetical protein